MRGIAEPYYLTVKPFMDGSYLEGGRRAYILDSNYSHDPHLYIGAFKVLQKDYENLLEYIYPTQINSKTYSYRTYELLLRVCTEIESNFKAILRANKYTPTSNLNMNDYVKVNASHYLSQYQVRIQGWHGSGEVIKPYAGWKLGKSPSWYKAYNNSKHNTAQNLKEANFTNLTNAMSGLAALIAAQYHTVEFSSADNYLITEDEVYEGFETGIGGIFYIKFPSKVPFKSRYNFHWLTNTAPVPFQQFDYDAI